MAAGNCKAAYNTDEWHGYGCEITEGECMFLYPNSKLCAEKYGEGPDAKTDPEEIEDDMTKYGCEDCGNQFILGDMAVERCSSGYPMCPYCGKNNISWRSKADAGDIDDMGCMAIWTSVN